MEDHEKYCGICRQEIFFILQNLYYLEENNFIAKKSEVESAVKGVDLQVWECFLNDITVENVDQNLDLLLNWCKDVLKRTSGYDAAYDMLPDPEEE